MPLSEEELRLLEQMERALVQEDPKFASTLRGTTLRSSARRRALLAGVVFMLGVVVLMTGAVAELPPVGIAGFLIMLGAATFGLTAMRAQTSAAGSPRPDTAAQAGNGPAAFTLIHGGGRGRRPRKLSHGSFMERMEDRWRRRRDEGGF